ncbi:MAG: ribosome-associated translation inhibitor RaiA [Chloroflexota bacterium]|jgi:putative sigma-54 modulation protein
MKIVIKGKNVEVANGVREYVEKKLGKLDRHLDNITEVLVELSNERTRSAETRQVIQVTILANGRILRGEERSGDVYAAVDAVVDKMKNRIDRYKGRLYGGKGKLAMADVLEAIEIGEEESRIVRTKRFELKPMYAEEAIEQMELLGHDFYIFFNAAAEGINVVYRRQDGNYGLLQPELP